MKKQCKVILQNNKYDCAFACLAMLFSYKDIEVPTSAFTENEIIGRDGVSLKDLKDICTKKQATLKIYRVEKEEFKKLRVNINKPYLVYWNNNHYVILEKIKKNKIVIIDPAVGRITISLQEIIYVFLTIFLYLLKCPQSLILSALRAFCFCGKPRISRSIFLYFPCQSWLKSW